MKLTSDQKFVWDKLVAEDFQEMENYFWDNDGIRNGSWIDVLAGDFGANWMRYAVLNGSSKTMEFLGEYGWNSKTDLYTNSQHDKTNYTLGAVALLEGDLKQIQRLYEWKWLKGDELVTHSSQVHVHEFAILNRSVPVASWLIDQRAKSIHTEKQLVASLVRMNAIADRLHFSQELKLDEPLGERYKIYSEHLIANYTQSSPRDVLPALIKIAEKDQTPNKALFNDVCLQMLLSSPRAFDQSMQKVWGDLIVSNPKLWFTFATEFPIQQITHQQIQMLEHSHIHGSLPVIQKWITEIKHHNPKLFNQFSVGAQNLADIKYRSSRNEKEIQQALEHTRLLLQVQSERPHTPAPQRKI